MSAMLVWLMEHDYIEAALVSGVEEGDAWKARPVLARTPAEVLATAGVAVHVLRQPVGGA